MPKERKTIDGFVYNRLIKVFNNFKEHNIKITFPLGNHDIYFRESLEVHLSDLFAKIFPEVDGIKDSSKVAPMQMLSTK